jgi:hypothetical protein
MARYAGRAGRSLTYVNWAKKRWSNSLEGAPVPETRRLIYTALRSCVLWREASDEAVERLADQARLRHFPEGTQVTT